MVGLAECSEQLLVRPSNLRAPDARAAMASDVFWWGGDGGAGRWSCLIVFGLWGGGGV